jgi:hypothetical protein
MPGLTEELTDTGHSFVVKNCVKDSIKRKRQKSYVEWVHLCKRLNDTGWSV